jgi:hypothetical protein
MSRENDHNFFMLHEMLLYIEKLLEMQFIKGKATEAFIKRFVQKHFSVERLLFSNDD